MPDPSSVDGTTVEPTSSKRFDDSFAASGDSSQAVVVSVPTGSDFYVTALITGGVGVVCCYVFTVALSFLWALMNLMQNCGQEFWQTDGETACNARLLNAVALSIELRCFNEKPPAMLQEHYEEQCAGFWMDFSKASVFFLCILGSMLYKEFGKIPSKVKFHEQLFVVESWNGKFFTSCFYADILSAESSFFGLDLKTKAKIQTDSTENCESWWGKSEKIMTIHGEATFSILSGRGEVQEKFLGEFARRLPLSIKGFDHVSESRPDSTESMLDGRLGFILKARMNPSMNPSGDPLSSVRKPISCDLLTEVLIIVLIIAAVTYLFAVMSNIFGWAMATGRGKCTHDMKPGVDLCDFVRVFSPIELPLVMVEEYVTLVVFVISCVAFPIWTFVNLPFVHRFHDGAHGAMEEVLLADWDFQASKFIFHDEIESLDLLWGRLEKLVKIKSKVIYLVKHGRSKPFEMKVRYGEIKLKITLPDPDCASCSGHGSKATSYKESILQKLNELKPGLLPQQGDETEGATEA